MSERIFLRWVQFLVVWMVILLGASTVGARGGKTTDKAISARNSMAFYYIGDNGNTSHERTWGEDDNRGVFNNELHLEGKFNHWQTIVKLEQRIYPGSPAHVVDWTINSLPGTSLLQFDNDVRAEELSLGYKHGRYHFRFGDYPVKLGQGIALHIDRETNRFDAHLLRGAMVEYEIAGKLLLAGYGGVTNSTNADIVTHSLLDKDPLDTVVALQARAQLMEAIQLGILGVHVEPRHQRIDEFLANRQYIDMGPGIRNSTIGGTLDVRIGGVSLYGEADFQHTDNYRVGDKFAVQDEFGMAGYLKLEWDSGPYIPNYTLRLVGEGIYYQEFVAQGTYRSASGADFVPVRYNQMPTLEPDWVSVPSLGNATGGRLATEFVNKRSDSRFKLAINGIQYHGGLDARGQWVSFEDISVIHPLFTWEQSFKRSEISFLLELGGRYEHTGHEREGFSTSGYLLHGGVELEVPLNQNHVLHISSQLRRHRLGVIEENSKYWINDNSVSYTFLKHWCIATSLQYSNELQGMDKRSLSMGTQNPLPRHVYLNGSISYEGHRQLKQFSVKLAAGTYRGGLTCFQGSCRQFPDSVGFSALLAYSL